MKIETILFCISRQGGFFVEDLLLLKAASEIRILKWFGKRIISILIKPDLYGNGGSRAMP